MNNYFAYPHLFWLLLIPIGFGVAVYFNQRWAKTIWARLGNSITLQRLLPKNLSYVRRWKIVLQISALLCWVLALAGPLIGSRLVEYKQRGIDVFIAVDCSASMLAEDLKPNRMSYAKLLLGQLIEKLVGDRIGIITFAGQAAIQCPLTVDTQAAAQLLDALQVGLVQTPGTAVGDAIRASFRGLAAGEQSNRVLILLTDGEDHKSDPIGAAKEAKSKGITIFPIGIGSAQGEPIPDINETGQRVGYKRDQKGDVVLSKLDETSLQEIARITGGSYYRASYSGAEVDAIHQALEQFKQGDQKTKQLNRFENRYQWPLGLGILLFLIALGIPEQQVVGRKQKTENRGQKTGEFLYFVVFFLLSSVFCFPVVASSLKDANRDFKRGRYEDAQKKYEAALVDRPHSPVLKYNLGNAAYQQGHFEEAEKKYADVIAMTSDPALKSLAHYNQGNAYYKQDQTTSAIEAYKEALRINPQDADAKYNLSLAMKAKQQGKGDPKQGDGNPEKGKDPNKQDSSQKGESKNKDPQSKDDQQKGNDQGQPKPKPGQMSKEDAERLLAAVQAGQPKTPTKKMKGNGKIQAEDW